MPKYSKEDQLYDYIRSYKNENGFPPTIREMCKAIKVRSTSTIFYYLNKLENSNKIKKNPNKNRALEIVESEKNINIPTISTIAENIDNLTRIPVLGTVTCGEPILAVQTNEEYFMVSPTLFKGNDLFMLTAKGDSMINAGIYDGDKIVLKQQSYADNGDIVAALIEDSATIKRFYKEDGHYRLQPENDTMSPIIVDNVQIIGKVVGLVRKF
ncbi:MAG: transcriptional repressor LexA [Clostridiales bacterium]|nr:transcriptional repressor LexA [Clostridiales bacterium]